MAFAGTARCTCWEMGGRMDTFHDSELAALFATVHGRASPDALQSRSGWASTVINGQCYELDYRPRYEPDHGPRDTSGRRAALRVGPPRYASGCGPRRTPDQLLRQSTTGPSDQRTDDADTYQWISRPRAPGACSRIHEQYAQGSDSVGWSLLHTGGPDNLGRVSRLRLLGPAAILG